MKRSSTLFIWLNLLLFLLAGLSGLDQQLLAQTDCQQPFVRQYDTRNSNLHPSRFSNILPHADGQFATLTIANKLLVVSLDDAGNIRWATELQRDEYATFTSLKQDRQGFLIGTGYGSAATPNSNQTQTVAFAFRIAPERGEVRWYQHFFDTNANLRATDIYELADKNSYLLHLNRQEADGRFTSLQQRLSRTDGILTGRAQQLELVADNRFENFDAYGSAYRRADGRLFLHGRSRLGFDFTPSVVCLDSNRAVLWARGYQTFTNHDGVVDMIAEAQSQVIFTTGASVGQAREGLGISRLDLDGNLLWSRQIDLPVDFFPTAGLANATGYVVLGISPQGSTDGGEAEIIIQTDRNGRALWARQYGSRPVEPLIDFSAKIAVLGSAIYYSGANQNGQTPLLSRLRADGSTADRACLTTELLTIQTTDVEVNLVRFPVRQQEMLLGEWAGQHRPGILQLTGLYCEADDRRTAIELTICAGESVLVHGEFQNIPGVYLDTLPSLINGCDSISEVTLFASDFFISTTATAAPCQGAAAGAANVDWSNTAGPVAIRWSTGDTTAEVTNLEAGIYGVTITSALGCESTKEVIVPIPENNDLALPDDFTLRFGDSVIIRPVFASGDGILWSSDLGDSCRACPTFTVRPSESTVVTATLNPGSTCALVERLNITVDKRELIFIPTAFSPNGDGTNDVFRPYPGPAITRIKSFRIFDRWGNLVYQVNDVSPTAELAGWDGILKDKELAIGVYVYALEVLTFDGQSQVFRGEVALVR